MKTDKLYFWDPCLRGIGQIMLQESSLTGLLFLIGILINSPIMALAVLVATVTATLTARVLKYPIEEINAGLYGFNAGLIGVGLLFFYQSTPLVWIAIILLSALSSVIMHVSLRRKIPVFTFPFILLVWIALFLFNHILLLHVPAPHTAVDALEGSFSIYGHGLGFGEVIFQGNLISGLIFILAVYLNSPTSALYGVLGVLIGTLVAVVLKDKIQEVQYGMFGFNAVLCAIVFGGPKKIDGLFVVISVLLAGLIELGLFELGAVGLTFPFVLSTWIVLWTRKKIVANRTCNLPEEDPTH